MNNEANELLEKHFDLAFSAPNGVPKLRELILTFAMQGKLVPQDPNDQPASELLKAIEVQKHLLVKEGKIKQPKPLPEIKLEEIPYQLPPSWRWVRLGEVVSLLGDGLHGTPAYDETGDYFFINGNNLSDGIIEIKESTKRVAACEYHKHKKELSSQTVLVSINGTIGNVAFYNDEKVILGKSACYFNLFEQIDKQFIKFLFNSAYFLGYAVFSATGSTIKNVSLKAMREFSFPLPPLAEQRRIVAKIDRLMAQCDELENLGSDRNQKRITIHTAAIDRLLAAQRDSDFSTAWDFIRQHFGELYSVKENVAELRKAILQLAVMGKLVPQDPNDEPASELLRAIELEKQRLMEEGKIKQPKLLSEFKLDEVPYDLPIGWKWVRLGNVGAFERGRSKHRPRNDQRLFIDGIYPFVQTGDVSKAKSTNYEITSCSSYYNDFGLSQSRLWAKGTLCITIAANIAETGFLGIDACIPDSVVAFLSINNALSRLVKFFIDVVKQDLERFAPSTAQKNINLGIINDLIFPLPPLAEQQRIVAKIDRLMALCDELEKQIDAATDKRTELLNALMAQV
jgi:type I restriction enzyme, S subunit